MFYRLVSRSILLQRLKLALAGAEKDPGGRGHNNSQLKKEVKELIFLFLDDRSNFVLNIFQLFFSLFFGWPSPPPFLFLVGNKMWMSMQKWTSSRTDARCSMLVFLGSHFWAKWGMFPKIRPFFFFQKYFPHFQVDLRPHFSPVRKGRKCTCNLIKTFIIGFTFQQRFFWVKKNCIGIGLRGNLGKKLVYHLVLFTLTGMGMLLRVRSVRLVRISPLRTRAGIPSIWTWMGFVLRRGWGWAILRPWNGDRETASTDHWPPSKGALIHVA